MQGIEVHEMKQTSSHIRIGVKDTSFNSSLSEKVYKRPESGIPFLEITGWPSSYRGKDGRTA
jgi:hypothetical protein